MSRPARTPVPVPAPASTPAAAPSDRIAAAFERCRARGEAALVTYVMGGDPDLATSQAMALACAEGGADLLELGVPFSDPIADGPTIQAAAQRALAHGTTPAQVLAVAAAVRARHPALPIALMGYLNPLLSHGPEQLGEDCARIGVDALIVPDLLPEEAGVLAPVAARGAKLVFLLAPTSTEARIEAAARAAGGFLYFVSVTGVTGAGKAVPAEIGAQVKAIRARSPVPVVIGFGVSTPEQARSLAPLGDGVVVGSAIVQRVAEGGSRAARAARVERFVRSLKRALGR